MVLRTVTWGSAENAKQLFTRASLCCRIMLSAFIRVVSTAMVNMKLESAALCRCMLVFPLWWPSVDGNTSMIVLACMYYSRVNGAKKVSVSKRQVLTSGWIASAGAGFEQFLFGPSQCKRRTEYCFSGTFANKSFRDNSSEPCALIKTPLDTMSCQSWHTKKKYFSAFQK